MAPMSSPERGRWPWLLVAIPVAILVLSSAATFVYIHFIAPDPAPKLDFASASASASDSGDPALTAAGAIDGTWKVSGGSEVQYRVHETLEGQDNEATGSTDAVSGQLAISGTTVSSALFSVDMTTFSSDESQRDGQFQNRIMNTSRFPTATFELATPIVLD